MRSYRWAEPARSVRPGTDCLTGALRIAHAYSNGNIHGDSDGYRYSHSYGDVYIHAYTDGDSDVDTYSNNSAYAYGYSHGHSYRNVHARQPTANLQRRCLRVHHDGSGVRSCQARPTSASTATTAVVSIHLPFPGHAV